MTWTLPLVVVVAGQELAYVLTRPLPPLATRAALLPQALAPKQRLRRRMACMIASGRTQILLRRTLNAVGPAGHSQRALPQAARGHEAHQ